MVVRTIKYLVVLDTGQKTVAAINATDITDNCNLRQNYNNKNCVLAGFLCARTNMKVYATFAFFIDAL